MKRPKTIIALNPEGFDKITAIDSAGNLLYYRGLTYPVKKWRFNLAFPTGRKVFIKAYRNGIFKTLKLKIQRLKRYNSDFIKLPKYDHYKPSKKLMYDPATKQMAYNHLGNAIYIGQNFYHLPYFVRPFIIFHEQGHNYYWDEEPADLYAIKQMIDAGANPSDIIYALDEGLTESNLKQGRIKQAYNYLLKL